MIKKNSKNEIKQIPIRNYFIVLVVSVVVIILTLYARAFYFSYQESKSKTSYFLDKKVNQITTDDLDYSLSEYRDAILYVSYTGNKSIYKMEKKIYSELEKNNLLDIAVYWNVSNLMENNDYINILKTKFNKLSNDIKEAPLIIIIKDGQAIEVLNSELDRIDYKELRKMIKRNEIE